MSQLNVSKYSRRVTNESSKDLATLGESSDLQDKQHVTWSYGMRIVVSGVVIKVSPTANGPGLEYINWIIVNYNILTRK